MSKRWRVREESRAHAYALPPYPRRLRALHDRSDCGLALVISRARLSRATAISHSAFRLTCALCVCGACALASVRETFCLQAEAFSADSAGADFHQRSVRRCASKALRVRARFISANTACVSGWCRRPPQLQKLALSSLQPLLAVRVRAVARIHPRC